MPATTAVDEIVLETDAPIDLRSTLAPLAHGSHDPTIRFTDAGTWLALRTVDGPATLLLRSDTGGARVRARAWGPGAARALGGAADLVGMRDEPEALVARHAVIGDLQRRYGGLRLPTTRRVMDALVPAICEQKVTGAEARRAYHALVRAHGAPAPGPGELVVAPPADLLAALPYHAYHPFDIERRRAETIRRAGAAATRLETAATADAARAALLAIPGIGPWTVAEVLRVSHGDPDAVSIGDYHLPSAVAWALAREPRASDERMLELLEPYRGQRGRVQRLIEVARITAPRHGPRMASRSIGRL